MYCHVNSNNRHFWSIELLTQFFISHWESHMLSYRSRDLNFLNCMVLSTLLRKSFRCPRDNDVFHRHVKSVEKLDLHMHCELSSDSTKALELEISVRIVAELAILRPHSFAVILANEESHLFDDLLRFDITSALQLNIERCLISGSKLVAITILAAIVKALLHESEVVIGLRAERVPIFYLNLIVVSSLVWWELYSIGDVGRLGAD